LGWNRCWWDEFDLLAAELDLELIAGLQAQLGGVGFADHQVAVELHAGGEAQAAARPPLTATATAVTEANALGVQQGLIKCGEVQALARCFLVLTYPAERTRSDFDTSPSSLTLASSSDPVSMEAYRWLQVARYRTALNCP